MAEFEQSDLEKDTDDSHNTFYQKAIRYVIDKLLVAGVKKNKHRGVSRGFYFP